jgi:hypothetical protein
MQMIYRKMFVFPVFVCTLGKCSRKYSTLCVWSNVKQTHPCQPPKPTPQPTPATHPATHHNQQKKSTTNHETHNHRNPIANHHRDPPEINPKQQPMTQDPPEQNPTTQEQRTTNHRK